MVLRRNNIVVIVLLVIGVSSAQIRESAPKTNSEDKNTFFGLPFLDISNGRIRVNFGGYHAEAGLGGLLGNSAADGTAGGLYAGAGTPSGAHASAGLGGTVNGDNTGGLLQARAGLGNGGPEAAAGLGGNLDGVDPTQSRGVLWKSTSRGGTTQITSKSLTADSDDKNIQKIPASKTTHLRIGSVVLPSDSNTQFVRRDVSNEEKLNTVEVTQPPTVYYSPTRRCQRKRLCRGFSSSRKTVVQQQPLAASTIDTADSKYSPEVVAPGPAPELPSAIRPRTRTTLFDDIFNIPISTLVAVNQLLNNKAKQQ